MLLALLLAATLPNHGGRYVVDEARVVDPAAAERVTASAKRLDDAGIAQLVVATVPQSYLGDMSLEEYAVALFQKWAPGHGKKLEALRSEAKGAQVPVIELPSQMAASRLARTLAHLAV